MTNIDSNDDRASRIGRIQAIVQEDFDRIHSTTDPFVILNLSALADAEEVRDRYERYERFYRAENFQRLGDMDLTRRALDVRRAIGRAMVQIQTHFERSQGNRQLPPADSSPSLPAVDPDAAAMGDIYYRDGLTYLHLGDFSTAGECFQRACEHDPSRGILLAHLAYTQFKIDPTSATVSEITGQNLRRAASMEPDNPEIFVLLARFGINTRDLELARRALVRLEELRPNHPRLARLKKRAKV